MTDSSTAASDSKRYSGWQVAFFVLLAIVLTGLLTWFLIYRFLFPPAFRSTELSPREQEALEMKLEQLESVASTPNSTGASPAEPLQPERYVEDDSRRVLNFTERELNSFLADSPEIAQRMSIALDNDLASAKLLIPVPPDFPLLGSKTMRVNAGLELGLANNRPVVALQGVTLWGVPIPNAWLGGLKQVDLVQEFGAGDGFWNAFAEGVEDISVQDGELQITLKE